MTVRLVALISIVLLLSLAALGLLMNHYQGRVMDEVARTASEVGRAALSTLDPGGARLLLHSPSGPARWRPRTVAGAEGERRIVAHVAGEETASDAAGSGGTEPRRVIVRQTWTLGERIDEPASAPGAARPECATAVGEFFIDVEHVRAESDPAHGLVLKLPKLTPEPPGPPSPQGGFAYRVELVDDAGSARDDVLLARQEEIRLPIPLEDYRELFASLRRRSLFLFLGVFVVGTALSAGVATRFTRPIRRLDAGIRRLAEGDLDVEVQVTGKDEIARLGRAFNDMARKLRASRERSRELVRREKLSALGRLAAGVAHDVRNPLHSIGLTLQHLSDCGRPTDPERADEFDRGLELIRGEIRRLDRLVGNFLRFARSERRDRGPVHLAELVRETVRLVGKEAEWRDVRVELDVTEGLAPVPADGEALRSAVLNLVLNAFEAMPEGGTLRLALRQEGEEQVLEVTDTGAGIPQAEQDRVFEFAYTAREGGSGLGLAMVHHSVVEEHGGRVVLDSRPGAGTRVQLALPLGHPAGAVA